MEVFLWSIAKRLFPIRLTLTRRGVYWCSISSQPLKFYPKDDRVAFRNIAAPVLDWVKNTICFGVVVLVGSVQNPKDKDLARSSVPLVYARADQMTATV